MKLTKTLAAKVLKTVDAGLVSGMGKPEPGFMCVEAAVNYALGAPHGDNPSCVGESVRRFKIRLNDANWSSDKARTNGMRKLAIAQLGSDTIDQGQFRRILAEGTIRRIVPEVLRIAAKLNPKHAEALEAAAVQCEKEGTKEASENARAVARAAAADADAADAAAYAAYAADAAAYAAYAADAAAAAADAADAADAAAAAADAYAAYAARDRILSISADIALQALIECKSPGCKWLYLTEEAK